MLFKPLTVFLHLLANPNQQKHALIPQNYYFLKEFSTFYMFARVIVILKSKFQLMLFSNRRRPNIPHSYYVMSTGKTNNKITKNIENIFQINITQRKAIRTNLKKPAGKLLTALI